MRVQPETKQHTPRVLRRHEAMKYLGIGRTKLWELQRDKIIPFGLVGNVSVFDVRALDEWIKRGFPTEPGVADEIQRAVAAKVAV